MARTDVVAGNEIIGSELLAAINEVSAEVDLVEALLETTVIKAADEIVSNSTTLQDDDELTVAVAIATYEFEAVIFYGAGTTADIKFAWTFPTATFNYRASGLDSATLVVKQVTSLGEASATSKDFGGPAVGSIRYVRYQGTITVTVAGTLTFQWAQNSAVVENTVVKAGSYLTLRKTTN